MTVSASAARPRLAKIASNAAIFFISLSRILLLPKPAEETLDRAGEQHSSQKTAAWNVQKGNAMGEISG